MKINTIIISLFLFHTLFIRIFSNYIILPFNIIKLNSSSFLSKSNYYTLLSIGQPQKVIEMYLIFRQYSFYLGKGLCRQNSSSNYKPYESETLKNNSDYEYSDYQIGDVESAIKASDNYFFYRNDLDIKENITAEDVEFYYGVNRFENEIVDKEKVCGIIGFNIYGTVPKYKDNYFINILKQKNIISSNTFCFIFYNNYTENIVFSKKNKYDNYVIIGMSETEIAKSFNTNDLRTIRARELSSYDWCISIDEILLKSNNYTDINMDKTSINKNIKVNFDNEIDFIFIQKSDFNFIYDYFFKEYVGKNICVYNFNSSINYYNYISCNTSFKSEMNKFPDINFMIRDINYTFTFTYKDLFIEINQKIYFMLVNDYQHENYWTFGNIFFQKFPLVFDYDKKTITFINKNNNDISNGDDNDINYLLFLILGIGIIIGVCFGVIIGKIIWDKNRKKRANELADDYDYNIKDDINEQRNIKNIYKINN